MPDSPKRRPPRKKKQRQSRGPERRQFVTGEARAVPVSRNVDQALQESHALLHAVIEGSPDLIFLKDLEGRYLMINSAAARQWGHSVAQSLGKTDAELYPPEIARMFRERDQQVLTTGQSITFEDTCSVAEGARTFLVTKGLLRDRSGKPAGVFGIGRDTTESKRTEDDLRKSESLLRAILESEPECVKRLASDGTLLDMNPAGLVMIEAESAADVVGKSVYGLIVPEHREAFRQLTERVCRGESGGLEFEIRGLKGTRRWLETRAVPLRRERDGVTELLGVTRDITERRLREESERKLSQAVEQSDEIIFMTGLDGAITYVNPAFQKIYGITKEEAIGKTPRILKGGTRPPEQYEQFWKTLLSGKSIRSEFENRTKEGRLITVRAAVSPVFDSHGKMMGFIAVQEDVTAHKFAQEALQQSEARLRELFEHATLGIYRSSRDGRFLDVNPALVSMLGYTTQEELLAVSIAETVYANPADRERMVKEYASAGTFTNVPLQWKRKDGKPISVHLSGRAVRDARGAFDYFEIFVENITERQALEKQFYAAQKFEAIGHLAGGVAHDFNNVLAAIIGWAELCSDSAAEDTRLRKGLGVIIEQANHAVGLTRQLLAFARRQHMEPRVIDLNKSVREVSTLLGSVIGRDIELKTSLATDIYPVLADPTHFEQVLMNLCVNARDAMPRGGKLLVETKNAVMDEEYCLHHPYAHPGQYVQLSVSDTGVGMDATTLDHVFEPFFTTKEFGKGTGLGLATVYGIAKQHGGFIHAYSEVGSGSTFHVYFPACAEIPSTGQPREAPLLRGGTETILLAEDNKELAAAARESLEGNGYAVLWARNGEEAVRLFKLHHDRVALLVFDVVMPNLSGPDAYVKIRALRDNIPVVFISGHSFESPALSSLVERGAEFLQKPYSTKALLLKIRELLDRQNSSSASGAPAVEA